MNSDYQIPYEAAESIAVAVLKHHLKMINDELEKYYDGRRKMVEADIVYHHKLSKHLSTVIGYFGS